MSHPKEFCDNRGDSETARGWGPTSPRQSPTLSFHNRIWNDPFLAPSYSTDELLHQEDPLRSFCEEPWYTHETPPTQSTAQYLLSPHRQPSLGSTGYAQPYQLTRTASLIYDIRDSDVLCGRGAPSTFHEGNQYFRRLVTNFQPAYLACRRADKPEIAIRILDMVRERGGRFLKRIRHPGVGLCGHFCWQEIGEQRAYEKTCQALREGAPEIRRRMAAIELASSISSRDTSDGCGDEELQNGSSTDSLP